MPLAPEFDVTLTLYYEVHDSEWFGGPGEVGYSSQSFNHVQNSDNADEAFIKAQIAATASMLGVTPDKLKIIPYEQYKAATEEDDEEEEEPYND